MAPRTAARAARAPAAGLLLFLLLLLPAHAGAASVEATDERFFNPRFAPVEVRAAPGEEVRVRNTGQDRHTFTATGGSWPELDLAAGREGVVRAPAEPGSYRFYCRYHASADAAPGEGMAGVLVVGASAQPPPPPPPARPAPLPPLAALAALALGGLAMRRLRG